MKYEVNNVRSILHANGKKNEENCYTIAVHLVIRILRKCNKILVLNHNL